MEKKIYSAPVVEVLEVIVENDFLENSPWKLPTDGGENGQGYNDDEVEGL